VGSPTRYSLMQNRRFTRVIGYENIIEIVAKYLKSYHFAKRFVTPPPAQLMIMLLGEWTR